MKTQTQNLTQQLKTRKWLSKGFIAFVLFYLVRDLTLYVLIPYFLLGAK